MSRGETARYGIVLGIPPVVDCDDAVLAELVSGKDQEALAVLYERHGAACYRLARQITASGALAEDAVQEAFVGLWLAPGAYQRRRGSVRNWLLARLIIRRSIWSVARPPSGGVRTPRPPGR